MYQSHPLFVKKIVRETPDAVSITFDVPEELKSVFSFKAGQYVTLKFNVDGKEERRAYSMSGSPLETGLTITVKRVKGGLISNIVNDQVEEGNVIQVFPPQGRFCPELDEENRKTYYLFAAGSGITPVFSILKTILETEIQSSVFLLYGNRNGASIIFKERLAAIEKTYSGQFFLEHMLSQPKREKAKGLGGLFKKGKISWPGKVGRIGTASVIEFIEEHQPPYRDVEYFICGPGDFIDVVEATLLGQGIDNGRIHSERFFLPDLGEPQKVKGADGAKAFVELHGQSIEIDVPPGKTILETLKDADYAPPYSCTAGMCSTCVAKLHSGKVEMEACHALEEEEIEAGYILTCQSHPTTKEVKLTYDKV